MAQDEAVVPGGALGLVGEAGPPQGPVEPLPRAVAREHSPRAVGAVGGRGQADDRQPRPRVAEAGERLRPVGLAAVALRRLGGAGLAPLDQPRAEPAGVHLRGEVAK